MREGILLYLPSMALLNLTEVLLNDTVLLSNNLQNNIPCFTSFLQKLRNIFLTTFNKIGQRDLDCTATMSLSKIFRKLLENSRKLLGKFMNIA